MKMSGAQRVSDQLTWENTGIADQVVAPAKQARPHLWAVSPTHLPTVVSRTFSLRYSFAKRSLDLLASAVLMTLVFPMCLVIAICIKMTSSGPIFYREERIGRFGIPFRIVKFRSMYSRQHQCDVLGISEDDPHIIHKRNLKKTPEDSRITPIGQYLRKWSLDELPQLINVFRGQMSLVGPRPIVEAERTLYGPLMSYYTLLTPGMTGLWQISGRSGIGFEGRSYLDSDYGKRWSLLLDLEILAKTVPVVLARTGAY
ncbi:sugar transferase [Acidicapsa ligni]|uniref:sugar transferase n=1 Tax=Acidicapsa ligni TaxID=542300 RepID=UPI0021E0A62E|nr:sugar transferase [Acidicapsa ligni]